ncbi:MAG: hypothetical protein AAF829_01365 [Pseudomonadota bacterium]
MKPILVVGTGRPLGAGIALRLLREGNPVIATRFERKAFDGPLAEAGACLKSLDLRDSSAIGSIAPNISAAVLVPILSLSGPAARQLAEGGVSRGVVFSSNNVAVAPEAPVYKALAAAEDEILSGAPDWAVLRPTMIYGHLGSDALAGLLRRAAEAPVLPIPGRGSALQQPIHIRDLQALVIGLASAAWPARGILPVGGAQVLSQAELLGEVYRALGRPPRVLRVPLGPARFLARCADHLGITLPLDRHQLARIDRDKHIQSPVDIPEAFRPRSDLGLALVEMAERLGLIPQGR